MVLLHPMSFYNVREEIVKRKRHRMARFKLIARSFAFKPVPFPSDCLNVRHCSPIHWTYAHIMVRHLDKDKLLVLLILTFYLVHKLLVLLILTFCLVQ